MEKTETIQVAKARIWSIEFGDNFERRNFNAPNFELAIARAKEYARQEIKDTPAKYQEDAQSNYEITKIELIAEED